MGQDKKFLQMAITEGEKGTAPHLYGAVVVHNGEILSIDHNHVWEKVDPSAHAEVSAIKQACQKIGSHNLPSGTILYASHEPCIMCFTCAAWANIDRVVFAHPASELSPDSYEFKDLSIYEVAEKLQKQINVQLISID